MNAFLEGKRLTSAKIPLILPATADFTVYNRTQEAISQQLQEDMDNDSTLPLSLVDHFVALLLAIFIESGLLEVRIFQARYRATLICPRPSLLSFKRTLAR
jgi:hypothetical protein